MVRPGTLEKAPIAPGRLPGIGHLLALWRDPLRFLTDLRTTGPVVRVDIGTLPVHVLTAPDLVREALTSQAGSLTRGRIYDRARALFGDGLATSEGALHRTQRRLVQPAFHRRRIAGYATIMGDRAQKLVDSWQPGQQLAFDQVMHELTLGIVLDALFSTKMSPTVGAEIQRLMPTIMTGIFVRMATPKQADKWPIPPNRRFDDASHRLRAIVGELVADYRSQDEERDDLLSMLMTTADEESGLAMSDKQVCDEVVSLLMAGTETPGNTLAWAFHELAAAGEVEQRLYDEITTVVGDGPIGLDAIPKLTFTSQVLNEVLRLHPVLLFTRRVTAEIVMGGVRVPVGAEVAYSPYALHRDPDLYPEPLRFDPDRWTPERAAHLPPHTFSPFGAGYHKCVGDAFATTEMHIALATIVRRWRLRPVPGHTVKEALAEVPRPDALPMTVEPR